MSNQKFYNRIGFVQFMDGNKVLDEFRGLNFRFSCEFADTQSVGRVCQANVGILGLTGKRIHRWSTFCNGTDGTQYGKATDGKNKFVSVFAGYEGQGFDEKSPLFTMPIVGAYPTSPPNMWLNISAFSGCADSFGVYDAVLESRDGPWIRFADYCRFAAKQMGAELRWDGIAEKLVRPFPRRKSWGLVGPASDILKYLNGIAKPKVSVYLERRMPDISTPILVVSSFEQSPSISGNGGGDIVISAEDGMIGLPKVTFGGGSNRDIYAGQIEVTSLLRRDIEIGKQFTVKSEYIEFANDTFVCTKIKHHGELRGREWYTTITGLNKESYGKGA